MKNELYCNILAAEYPAMSVACGRLATFCLSVDGRDVDWFCPEHAREIADTLTNTPTGVCAGKSGDSPCPGQPDSMITISDEEEFTPGVICTEHAQGLLSGLGMEMFYVSRS